jgi:hypothetical protein
MQLQDLIQWQTHTGQKITVGDVSITPQSSALVVRWPYGGLVWNRPTALLVDRGDYAEHIPIEDVTRKLQLTLLGLGMIFTILAFILSAQKGEPK